MNLGNQEQKSKLRKEILQKRNSLSDSQIASKSKLIQEKIIGRMEFIESRSIGIYVPIGSEVRTNDIIRSALESEKTVLLPRIIIKDLHYFIVEEHDLDQDSFDINKFGIKEPKKTKMKSDFIDLLIVPGIVFDSHGYRIGYGHGYYDRFMAEKKFSKSIGLAYDFQVVKNPIPKSEFDKKIDLLITESGVQVFDTF
ncbi:MAG TPA: 5-formyltetrahydrofolate cyclo-ligase [Nitrososphaeraceae archaeon]|nr:5-formyltetrahydrofolate cyclo-ligase [Nitrososphaeraceae archaeon]